MTNPNPAGGHTVRALLAALPGSKLVRGAPETPIAAIEHDSRRAGPGTLFVAVPGFTVDGHQFLPQVAVAGAAVAVVEAGRAPAGLQESLALIEVSNSRAALAEAAAWFYGYPGRELVVLGVTGTDGKTTTSHLLTTVIEAAGGSVGRLGTVDTYLPGGETGKVTDRMTTPEAPEVQRLLRRMVDAGCEFAIVESTSHGLALHRLDHVEYDVAVFTNITGDHLDFHETFEAYREAKGQLFAALDSSARKGVQKSAVVNMDDPSANYMLGQSRAEPIRYGLEARETEVAARNIVLRADGESGTSRRQRIHHVEHRGELDARLGHAQRCLQPELRAIGAEPGAIAQGLAACPGVPGRMERIVAGQPFEVIVDYAHTGDAVRKVLEVLRDVSKGQLIIVVGAAGERDPGRRFGVGRAAAEGADFAVFTSEDPRSEDPGEIVREIGRHAEGAGRVRGRDFVEVEDRREAIAEAFRRAKSGDIVVVAGKGHETSMIYGTESRPWDDRDVARQELGKIGYRTA